MDFGGRRADGVRPTGVRGRSERDDSPFAQLAREHESALYAFALRLTGAPDDARDLAQDALERALRRFATFVPGTNGRAWLFSILHNAFIDRCRRRAAEPKRTCIEEVEVAEAEPDEAPAWTSITREQLTVAIASLERDFRVVYELHAIEGLAYQEIAMRLKLPVNTVGTRLARARKKLRTALEALAEGGAS